MKKFLTSLVCVGLVTLFAISCKIGLGQAVDTEPPEVEIGVPAVGAIIRDDFYIAGSWSDDGEIKGEGGLKVTLERTDGTGAAVTYSGTLDKDAWRCVIPAKTDALLDGEYQATVVMTDTYEHSTIKTTTFTIDNTPPIVVLQRPSANAESSTTPDSYGQSFTLEGQAADDNNVDLIEVNIYSDKECTNLIRTVELRNVPPTISLDVAKFVEGEKNDYSEIYGSTTKSGTVERYCKIVAYDGARRYPVDASTAADTDSKGNKTDFYYLYESIATSVLSKYKITEVYHMNNGNYSEGDVESRSAVIEAVQKILEGSIVKSGLFSLNPANNPTYSVSGRDQLKKDGTDFTGPENELSNDSDLVIEVAVGLDAIPLVESSLKVYVQECDANGNAIAGEPKIYPQTSSHTKSGTSYKFVTKIKKDDCALADGTPIQLSYDHFYLICVEGKDENNTPVVPAGKGFAVILKTRGNPPTIENPTIKPIVGAKSTNGILKVEGIISNFVNASDASWSLTKKSDGTVIDSGKFTTSEFKLRIPTWSLDEEDVTLKLKVVDETGVETTYTKDLYVDQETDIPRFVSPNLNKLDFEGFKDKNAIDTSTDNKNKYAKGSDLTFNVEDDDDIDTVEVILRQWDGSTFKRIEGKQESDPADGSYGSTVSVSLPQSTGIFEAEFIIKDTEGTTFTKDNATYKDNDPAADASKKIQKLYFKITGTNPSVSINATPAWLSTQNAAGDFNVNIVVDNEDKAPYKLYRSTTAELAAGATPLAGYDAIPENKSSNTASDDGDGDNTITTIKYKDNYAKGSSSGTVYYVVQDKDGLKTTKAFVYKIDNQSPDTPELTATPDKMSGEGTTFTIRGTVADKGGSGIDKTTIKFKDVTLGKETAELNAGADTITYVAVWNSDDLSEVFATEGKKQYTITAYDIAGNKTEKTETFDYDKASPTVAFTTYKSSKSGSANTNIENNAFDIGTTFRLDGTASDGYGIKDIVITESKDNGAAQAVTVETNSDKTTWYIPTLPKSGSAVTGTYKYEIKVTDNAGKETKQTLTVNIDTEAPTVTVTSPEANSTLSGTSTVFGGTVNDGSSDANQGVKNIYWAITNNSTAPTAAVTDTSVWTKIEKLTTGKSSANWDLNRNLGTGKTGAVANTVYEGAWYLHVKAEDKAGNITSSAVSVPFSVDQAKPELSDVKYGTNPLIEDGTYYYNNNESSFQITGNILESNELSTFTATVAGGSPVNITKPAASATAQSWTYTIPSVTADTATSVVITAKDPIRPEVTKKYTIYKDTQAPNITVTNPDADIAGEDALSAATYTFRANVNDTGAGIDGNKYYYAFSNSELTDSNAIIADKNAASPTLTWEEYTGGQAFSIAKDIEQGTTAASGKLCEGHWYLYIYAKDAVGHESAFKRSFWVDKAKPTLTTKVDSGTAEDKSADYTYQTPEIKAGQFTVYYKATDSHGLASTNPITVKVTKGESTVLGTDSSATAPYYTLGSDSGYTTAKLTVPEGVVGDDDYTFEITAKDLAGKTTTVKRIIRLDTKGPALTITSPDDFNTWQISSSVKIMGNATDATGVSAIYYALNPSTTPAVPSSPLTEANWTSGGIWKKANGTTSWNFTLEDVPDGASNKLYYSAVDTNGNTTAIDYKTLKVDATSPALDEQDIGMGGKSILAGASSLTLSGLFVEDTSGANKIKIESVRTDIQNSPKRTWELKEDSGIDTTAKTWSKTINLGSAENQLQDGEHTLTITIEDNAGNTGKIQRSLKIDTQAPTAGTLEVTTTADYTDSSSNKWYNTNVMMNKTKKATIDIKISDAVDTAKDGYSSGLLTPEYQVVPAGGTASEQPWISMTPQSTAGEYTASVNCTVQGLNTINVRVKDSAGNTMATDKVVTVCVDSATPEAPTDYWVELADTATENASFNYTDQLVTNKTKKIHVLLITSDANSSGTLTSSGIKEVRKAGGSSVVTSTSKFTPKGGTEQTVYDLEISTADSTSGPCKIEIVDNVGNVTTFSPFQIVEDTTPPAISLSVPSDADTSTSDKIDVNQTIEITVNASDNMGLQDTNPVELKYYVGDSAPSSWSNVSTTFTVDTSSSPWKATVDTISLTNEKYLYLQLSSTDKAGNSAAPIVKTLYINQDSDRPVIKFTNLTKDDAGNYILKYGTDATLEGIITDDDSTDTAVVEVFKASSSPITTGSGEVGTTTFTAGSGDFKYKPTSGDDGSKEVYFYIKDNKGREFYTTSTADFGNPYQQYKSETKTDNKSKLTYKSDGNAPKIAKVELQAWKSSDGTTDADKNGGATALGSSCVVGGKTKQYVDLTVAANDNNGIVGVTIEIDGKKASATTTDLKKYYRSNDKVSITGVSTYDHTGTVDATSNVSTDHIYTIPRLDLSAFAAGSVTVKVYAYDGAGLPNNSESVFVIDNTAPLINISTPSYDGYEVYATEPNTVGGSINGATDVSSIEYAVSLTATEPSSGWTTIPNATITASLVFDGNLASNEGGFHVSKLRDLYESLSGKTQAEVNAIVGNVDMYVFFKAIDNCGNEGVSKRKLSVIPNGDVPSVTLSYPDKDDAALAGTIRVYGQATIPIGTLDAVYIQIDPSFSTTFSTTWDTDDSNLVKNNYNVVTIPGSTMKGIKASGAQNWNLPLNSNQEFNIAGQTRNMAIRIYALSQTGKLSQVVERKFSIDPNAPHIGGNATGEVPVQLVQFNDGKVGDFSEIKNSITYTSDMWVNGQWYLIASVSDDSGIKKIFIKENNGSTVWLVGDQKDETKDQVIISGAKTAAGKDCIVTENSSINSKKNFNICIPLPTGTGSGSCSYEITAMENTGAGNLVVDTFTINYDNTAPRIATKDYSSGDYKYNIEPAIQQNNGFYQFGSYVDDSPSEANGKSSGIKGVAFYFVRRGSSNTRIYDPMYKNKFVTITNNSNITYSQGLFWQKKTVTRDTNNLTKLTLTSAPDASNIHAGGWVKLGGSVYRISSVEGDSVFVEGTPPAAETSAEFAIALIVDTINRTENTTGRTKITTSGAYGEGYYSASSSDDGDLMEEEWSGTSSAGQWRALINSSNIPDGPIELHYAVLDKSLNYSVGIVGNLDETSYKALTTDDAKENKTLDATATDNLAKRFVYTYDANNKAYVSNNAPRIAGVTVGTDYNGNTTIEDSEKTSIYVGQKTRKIKNATTGLIEDLQKATDVAKIFIASDDNTKTGKAKTTIKDKTTLEVEIVGGNGDLYYQTSIDGSYKDHSAISGWTQNNTKITFTRNTKEGNATDDNPEGSQDYIESTKLPAITFDAATIRSKVSNNTTITAPTWFTVEIWDSTEEGTKFVSSQYAELKLPLAVEIYDKVAPNTFVSPLYWNSAADNSVDKDINGNLFGHVELVKDITGSGFTNDNYGTNDDKVSGRVIFKGFAYDNKRLAKLEWAIVNSSGKSIMPNATSGITYNTGATFSSGTWSSTATMATNHYTFTVSTDEKDGAYLDGNGHRVAWTLTVDTSYINGVVAKDAKVYVRATDASKDNTGNTAYSTNMGATAVTTGTDAQIIKPTYQIDIVPYITSITTRLAKKNPADPTVYSRTAKGHYPIESNEGAITLSGFNLAAGNATATISAANVKNLNSGVYNHTVSGLEAINNLNNNGAHGDYDISVTGLEEKTKVANMYNRQPNNNTNLTLTDDVYFDVWDINSNAATSGAALKYPVMRINPTNNQIGFGFVKGADSVSFPANGKSYTWYQKNRKDYINTNFAYDAKGVAHTISIGLDAQWDSGIAGRMNYNNSTWYTRENRGSDRIRQWDKTYNIALESIGIPNGIYVKGEKIDTSGTSGLGIIDTDRFSTPNIVTSTHGDNTAVYIMYYDSDHDQIRFRYGQVPNNATSRNGGNYGLLNDSKSEGYNGVDDTGINSDTTPQNDNSNWQRQDHGMFEAHRGYYALVTGDYYKQKNDGLTGTDGELLTSTGNHGSEYHSLAVVPGNSMNNDKVVMIWYDQVNYKLMYMYRYNLGANDSASNTDASSTGVTDKWSAPKVLYDKPVQDVALTVDGLNGIHIAAYDQNDADLLYIYLPSYNYLDTATNTPYVSKVDGYSQIGSKLTIETALDSAGTAAIPYISYYAEGLSALPKVAFLTAGVNSSNAATVLKEGINTSNQFTGNWEVSMIPTDSALQKYNVNVGLFKDGGKLDSTKTGTNVTSSQDERSIYGNGNSHLVVGYAIKATGIGYIETAMYKGVPSY